MAQPDWKTGSRIATKAREIKDRARDVEESRLILRVEVGKEQDDQRDREQKDAEGKELQDKQ